jgi:hypothetical protein
MHVSDIMIWRDGGTITFVVGDSPVNGKYRLRSPLHGEPRPLFHDDEQIENGGAIEKALLVELRYWFASTVTTDAAEAIRKLDSLREWRNLPDELAKVVPLHWIRTVIRCLEARVAA